MSRRELPLMNMPRSRPLRSTALRSAAGTWAAALATVLATACGGSQDTIIPKATPEEIEAASARADSMLRAPDRTEQMLDSMRRAMDRQVDSAMVTTGSGDGTIAPVLTDAGAAAVAATAELAASAGREMSRRAQARGDSMARAIAAQLAATDASSDRARGDSVRGVLVWQGAEPARNVALKQGAQTVTLSGMATGGLGKLVGTEVTVRGVKVTPRDVVVSDFVVRAHEGVPALDGIVESDGSLRLTDGSGVRRVVLPEPVREMTGARVWIAQRNGRTTGYGLIVRR